MVTLTPDPTNPERLVLSQTLTVYLDKYLVETIAEELTQAIREQSIKDLRNNAAVRKAIAKAATQKLLTMLGAPEPESKEPTHG